MKKLDILTIGGIVLGMGLVVWGIAMGGNFMVFVHLPSMLITVGGSFGALLVNFHINQMRQVVKLTMQVIFEKVQEPAKLRELFFQLAQKARREGLLALEDDLQEIDDSFLREGLQKVIDGMDPEHIRDVMETEIDALAQRHQLGQSLFRTWGTLAPAFGMVGTLIGLVQMLVNLDNPDAIGSGMAVALLTTFYGALLANLILIPIAGKLEIRSDAEIAYREMILHGILALQAGVNPRILQDKIRAFLSPQERIQADKNGEAAERDELLAWD